MEMMATELPCSLKKVELMMSMMESKPSAHPSASESESTSTASRQMHHLPIQFFTQGVVPIQIPYLEMILPLQHPELRIALQLVERAVDVEQVDPPHRYVTCGYSFRHSRRRIGTGQVGDGKGGGGYLAWFFGIGEGNEGDGEEESCDQDCRCCHGAVGSLSSVDLVWVDLWSVYYSLYLY